MPESVPHPVAIDAGACIGHEESRGGVVFAAARRLRDIAMNRATSRLAPSQAQVQAAVHAEAQAPAPPPLPPGPAATGA